MTTKGKVACGVLGIIFVAGTSAAVYFGIKYLKKKKEMKDEQDQINAELDKDLPPINESDEEPKALKQVNFDQDSVREKLLKNWNKPDIGEGATLEDEMAEAEHPKDDDEEEKGDIFDDEEELENAEKDYENHKFYENNKHRPPKIISGEAIGDIPDNFEMVEWIYWEKDDVMTDEEDREIEDFMRFTGDTLDKYGWRDDDSSDHIYVLSYEFMSIYSITKYFLSYAEKMEEASAYMQDLTEKYGYGDEGAPKEESPSDS